MMEMIRGFECIFATIGAIRCIELVWLKYLEMMNHDVY
jgi:hypothetical protein